MTPRVLWPSLGRPVFVGAGQPSFLALVAGSGGRPDPRALRDGFRLVPVRAGGAPVRLDVEAVGPAAMEPDLLRLRRRLGLRAGDSIYEIRLAIRAGPDLEGRRSTLFDLVHPDLAPSRHAVAWTGHRWERLVLAFVPDIHLATVWDELAADAAKLPDLGTGPGDGPHDRLTRLFSRQAFAASFLDPNRRWRDFVLEANRRADRGELDLVVLGGDLVEYQFPANIGYFVDAVTGATPGSEPLGVPLLTVPGNHDYRRSPYRPQIYPLDRYGLHDLQRDHFFRVVRGERPARPSLRDLRAVLVRDGGRSPLRDYLLTVDARPDDIVTLGRTSFVLLDSGRDVFRDLARVRPRRWGNALRALGHVWLSPASAGFGDDQAAFLERAAGTAAAANLVVVFHAGLAAGSDGGREPGGAGKVFRLKPFLTAPDGLRTRARLERALARSGFGRGGLFRNQLALFRTAAATGRNILGLSGHFHRPVALRLDKASGVLSFERPPEDGIPAEAFTGGSFFVGGTALAVVDPRADPGAAPGFTRVEVAGDRIVSVRGESSPPPGRPRLEVRAPRAGEPGVTLTVSVSPAPAGPAAAGGAVGEIVFIVFARPGRRTAGGFPYRLEELTSDGVRTAEARWIDMSDGRSFFGRTGPAFIQAFRGGLGGPRRFRVAPKAPPRRRTRAVVAVEGPRGSDGLPAYILWHPVSVDLGAGPRRR